MYEYVDFHHSHLNVIVLGGGGPTPFLPMEKCVFSQFSPWGKMGKKVYRKKGKSIHFPLFPYTFFPIFPMGKMGKTHIFPWAKMGLDPPPPVLHKYLTLNCLLSAAAAVSSYADTYYSKSH